MIRINGGRRPRSEGSGRESFSIALAAPSLVRVALKYPRARFEPLLVRAKVGDSGQHLGSDVARDDRSRDSGCWTLNVFGRRGTATT